MATIHTNLPENQQGFYGEYILGEALKNIQNPDLELWFQINYLPRVTELDLILFHPNAGLFLIESKGYKIGSISEYNFTELVIFPNQSKPHPVTQARIGLLRLKSYLLEIAKNDKNFKIPFIQTSIVWPMITRDEWKQRFINEPTILEQTRSMLFSDDLLDEKKLLKRLNKFKYSPLLGTSISGNLVPDSDSMKYIRSYIGTKNIDPKISSSLKNEIQRDVIYSKELASAFPPPSEYSVIIEGPPGTGKTTVLREIGLLHAASGGHVLHVCFNTVLAADQRREYSLLKRNDLKYGDIEVFDEWELYRKLTDNWEPNVVTGENSRSKLAAEHVAEIISNSDSISGHPKHIYDTILIDESQDLSNALFELLQHLSRPSASWFVAYGEGQQIYFPNKENPAPILKKFKEKAQRRVLRRSFRNSTRAFLMAQNVWQNYPDIEKVESWITGKLDKNSSSIEELELQLELPIATNDFRITRIINLELNKKEIAIQDLILESLENAKKANRGCDLLIIVGDSKSRPINKDNSNYQIILKILNNLAKSLSIEVLDLVPRLSRRLTPGNENIRIVRYQSARGLSASHTLVFDVNLIEEWAGANTDDKKGSIENYLYIALSRSRVSTTVVVDTDEDSLAQNFIQQSLLLIRKKFLEK
jgi:hypothetical protein